MMKKEINLANYHEHISEKSHTSYINGRTHIRETTYDYFHITWLPGNERKNKNSDISSEELQEGPSGGAPEWVAIIIGGESSVFVIALEDLPVGQDEEVESVIMIILARGGLG